jgi:hypothetical protein
MRTYAREYSRVYVCKYADARARLEVVILETHIDTAAVPGGASGGGAAAGGDAAAGRGGPPAAAHSRR